jgi:hypothetical protein
MTHTRIVRRAMVGVAKRVDNLFSSTVIFSDMDNFGGASISGDGPESGDDNWGVLVPDRTSNASKDSLHGRLFMLEM